MRLSHLTGDSVSRALSCAERTALTLSRVDVIGEQAPTYAGRTLLIHNVSDILVSEVLHGGAVSYTHLDVYKRQV